MALKKSYCSVHPRVAGPARCVRPQENLRAYCRWDKEMISRTMTWVRFCELCLFYFSLNLPSNCTDDTVDTKDGFRLSVIMAGVLGRVGIWFGVTTSRAVEQSENKPASGSVGSLLVIVVKFRG